MRVFVVVQADADLRSAIEGAPDMELAGVAGSSKEALRQLSSLEPDVAVVDARLRDGSGVALAKNIRTRKPNAHCLVLASQDDDDDVRGAFMAGVTGCLLREAPEADLLEGIRGVSRGELVIAPSLAKAARSQPDPDATTVLLPEMLPGRALDVTSRPIAEPASADFAGARHDPWVVPYAIAVIAGLAAVVLLFVGRSSTTKNSRAAKAVSVRPAAATTIPRAAAATPSPSPEPPGIVPTTALRGLTPPTSPPTTRAAQAPQIGLTYDWADCEGGSLQVAGSLRNNGVGAYTVSFEVTVLSASGVAQGTASATIADVTAGGSRSFVAGGSCSGGLSSGISPSTHIISVTPA
jgi:DNA-binding NarL/FixJ family response regulator